MNKPLTSAAELRAWRERQTTANPRADHLTQAEAELWYGLWNGGRTWKRWEAGDSPVPEPLLKRIRAGVKVGYDEAEGYAAEVFERTLSPGQVETLIRLLGAHRRNAKAPIMGGSKIVATRIRGGPNPWSIYYVGGGRPPLPYLHGSTMLAFIDRRILVEFGPTLAVEGSCAFMAQGLALAERVEKAHRRRRR